MTVAYHPPKICVKCLLIFVGYMGVSKNRGAPKWMVYNGTPYYLMDDLGVPLFLETSISYVSSRQTSWGENLPPYLDIFP